MDKLLICQYGIKAIKNYDIIYQNDQFHIKLPNFTTTLISYLASVFYPENYKLHRIFLSDKNPHNLTKTNFQIDLSTQNLTIKQHFQLQPQTKFTENAHNFHYYNTIQEVLITDKLKNPITIVDLYDFKAIKLMNFHVKMHNFYPLVRKIRLHVLVTGQRGNYAVETHHRNQNQLDNRKANLVVLGVQEHQLEHRCQFVFKGAVDGYLGEFSG